LLKNITFTGLLSYQVQNFSMPGGPQIDVFMNVLPD